ncbi:MAG: SGNH/GDSL hydrolase family protein [Candidatus Dormibacteraceae bacterium]
MPGGPNRCVEAASAWCRTGIRARLRVSIGGLLAAAVGISLLAGCGGGSAQRSTSPTPSSAASKATPAAIVQFVGASVTHGLYSSGFAHAYPSDVVAALRQRGENVQRRVLAIPGATVGQALTWKIHRPANIVVVHMGSNNFVHNTPLSAFAPLYGSLVDALRKESPKADLVCLGEWHRPFIHNQLGNTPEDFDTIIAADCKENGGTFEPLEQIYAVESYHGPLGRRTPFGRADLHHPNDAGDAAIAQMVLQGLQQQPPLKATF